MATSDNDHSMLMLCPNNCGKVLERKSFESHVSTDCPMNIVDCEFKHVGCDVRLPRKDMLVHTEQAVIYHLKKQVENYEQRIKMLELNNKTLSKRCETLEAQHKELVEKVSEAFNKISQFVVEQRDQKQDSDDDDNRDYVNVDDALRSATNEDYSYVAAIKPSSVYPVHNLSTNFIMTNFQVHKKRDDHWVSRPFYTHSQGYKMCLRVTANGQGSGKGTHITVAVYLMKGEFDDQLEWPFRGNITIQLLNQQENSGHYTKTIFQAKAVRSSSEGSTGEKYICGWGISKFQSHSELHQRYLQNDSLRFHVSTLLKSKPRPEMIESEV